MSHRLQLPNFSTSTDTWGPSPTKNIPFADLPFAPFTKSTPINFIADFTPNAWGGTSQNNRNRGRGGDDEKSGGGGRFGRGGGRTRMGDEDAVLGDFSDNENDFGGTIVRTKKYDERRGRSFVVFTLLFFLFFLLACVSSTTIVPSLHKFLFLVLQRIGQPIARK